MSIHTLPQEVRESKITIFVNNFYVLLKQQIIDGNYDTFTLMMVFATMENLIGKLKKMKASELLEYFKNSTIDTIFQELE